ncbi:hypothetical protein [Agrococcus sp. SGAir0287]|uniref:hypothetical protein n=1 Tax=Agrococcus sp. SGAir0287 TaxID=2070347 RepID=UPI0010F945FB|nr:hypothetical protein [Agrococcus sp. SGAir0287]
MLIPLGIAAIAAQRAARATSVCERCRATVVGDQGLATETLAALGWRVLRNEIGAIDVETPAGRSTFRLVGEVMLARVDGAPEHVTLAMISEFDRMAGLVLQHRGVARARAQAEAMGMRLIEQQSVDGEIRLVFEEA